MKWQQKTQLLRWVTDVHECFVGGVSTPAHSSPIGVLARFRNRSPFCSPFCRVDPHLTRIKVKIKTAVGDPRRGAGVAVELQTPTLPRMVSVSVGRQGVSVAAPSPGPPTKTVGAAASVAPLDPPPCPRFPVVVMPPSVPTRPTTPADGPTGQFQAPFVVLLHPFGRSPGARRRIQSVPGLVLGLGSLTWVT